MPKKREYDIYKGVRFKRAEWKPIARWISAQRPRISEAEGLRRLADKGLDHEQWIHGQFTRKREEP